MQQQSSPVRLVGVGAGAVCLMVMVGATVLQRGSGAYLGTLLVAAGLTLTGWKIVQFAIGSRSSQLPQADRLVRLFAWVLVGQGVTTLGWVFTKHPDLLFNAAGLDSPLLPWNR